MPIYEYRCEACGHELEAIQKFSDVALRDCPVCGKSELKKLVSAAGFQLKGTGWYVTDFKDGGKSKMKKDSESESKPKKEEKTKDKKKASGSSSSDD
jgi:putative FmdB family regulatory protein